MKPKLIINELNASIAKRVLPTIHINSLVRVDVIIEENNKQRVQSFSGNVIKYHKAGTGTTLTIARDFRNRVVTRTFPVHSHTIQAIKLLSSRP